MITRFILHILKILSSCLKITLPQVLFEPLERA